MVDFLKSLPAVLEQLKSSTLLILSGSFLLPILLTIGTGGYIGLEMIRVFQEIAETERRQIAVLEDLAEWMQNDERRDSVLHAELVRYLQKMNE